MRKWKSHKIVEAEKIEWIEGEKVCTSDGETMDVEPVVFARGRPEPGDYMVRYEDGYLSWSPVKAFEDGHAMIESHG